MHLVEAVSCERGILEVQIGSQRVRQVHAHLLSGLSLLHHLYLTSYARNYLMYLVEAESLERGSKRSNSGLSVFAWSMRIF